MTDVFVVATVVAFFTLAWAFVAVCTRLTGTAGIVAAPLGGADEDAAEADR